MVSILFFSLIFIGLPVLIGALLYYIPKYLKYPKLGRYLLSSYGVFILVLGVTICFEDELFSKNEAKSLVEEHGVFLEGEFRLINNESIGAMGDYYHTFTLLISENDKMKAIEIIRKSVNFKRDESQIVDLYFDTKETHVGPKQTQNYETDKFYIREYLQPNGYGYRPTYRKIKLNKFNNELVFEEIDY